MGFPEDVLASARLTARAQRDLENLLKKDRRNFGRVWEDLKRLAAGTLPQRPKKLKGFEPLWIRGVLPKPEQTPRLLVPRRPPIWLRRSSTDPVPRLDAWAGKRYIFTT